MLQINDRTARKNLRVLVLEQSPVSEPTEAVIALGGTALDLNFTARIEAGGELVVVFMA